jgi:anhydro-N-acetylmuramic acid kinase
MKGLQRIIAKHERVVVGLMSGTSADGVDAALVRIRGSGQETEVETLAFLTRPYDEVTRKRVLAAGEAPTQEIAALNYTLGERFASAALTAIEFGGMTPAEVDFVSSHGQTVYHETTAEAEECATLQIGEGAVIAERTGLPVVCDFRARDVAAGGSGAPLVPYVDYILLRHATKNRLVINLGGIVNMTLLPRSASMSDVLAFDVGPCNVLLDALAEILLGRDRDEGGEVAAAGRSSAQLVDEVLRHPYFSVRPPKSTGRQLFGERFASQFVASARRLGLSTADTLASAGQLTVTAVVRSLETLISFSFRNPDEVIVSGGGTNNLMLMSTLENAFRSSSVVTSREYGLHPDAKEAIAFAILGNEALEGRPANLPAVTGASRPVVLGKIIPPNPRR